MPHQKNPTVPMVLSDMIYILLLFHLFFIYFAVFAVFSFFEIGFFKFLKLAVSFYSQIRHIFPIYYRRSQKDAPFYFPPEVISPSCLRHPFPKANSKLFVNIEHTPPLTRCEHIETKRLSNREPFFLPKKQLLVTLKIIHPKAVKTI